VTEVTGLDDRYLRKVSLSEVKKILTKMSKERKELLYEQRIALEHAQKFVKLPQNKTNDLINELKSLNFIEESHVFKICDILPKTQEDVKAIFAKERITLEQDQIKKILEIISKYYID
jgi:DNA-directed RNA polymerase subunit F